MELSVTRDALDQLRVQHESAKEEIHRLRAQREYIDHAISALQNSSESNDSSRIRPLSELVEEERAKLLSQDDRAEIEPEKKLKPFTLFKACSRLGSELR